MEKKKRVRVLKTPSPQTTISSNVNHTLESAKAELLALKKEQAKLLSTQVELMEGLPHLYARKRYRWQRDYFESTKKDAFICAANQIGKSTIQIEKLIHWATEPSLWSKLFRKNPKQAWYFYPSSQIATSEFEQKWVKDCLPRGKYKNHPQYGWKEIYSGQWISEINFNSGVTIYFKSYSQSVVNLQAGTVDVICADEELPVEYYDELNFRRMAVDGYFSMAFTATLAQEFWRETIEVKGEREHFRDAFKVQVSMWDCQKFEDGTNSHWTSEKILKAIASCKSEAEVQRRVYGKFVLDSGLRYSGFDRLQNFHGGGEVPKNWLWYGGADIGSGGDTNHPASIVFVAVSPDFKKGRVVQGWRGNGEVTTASDVLDKFVELRGDREFIGQFYDWSSKDFLTMAQRRGESFMPAEKSQEVGVQILNALFKNKILSIDENSELEPLVQELVTLQIDTHKTKAKDDFIDALRYAVTRCPWNWEAIGLQAFSNRVLTPPPKKSEMQRELEERRKFSEPLKENQWNAEMDIEDEISHWQELYDVV